MPRLAMELEEKLRKAVLFFFFFSSPNYSFSALFLLYILICLFWQAQQSRHISLRVAEVLPCVLLALLFSPPRFTTPVEKCWRVHCFVLCWLSQRHGSVRGSPWPAHLGKGPSEASSGVCGQGGSRGTSALAPASPETF